MTVYDELSALVDEILDQVEAGMAVDVERYMHELAGRLDERALADDLAAVLDKYADLFAGVTGQTTVEAETVLARYREARQR